MSSEEVERIRAALADGGEHRLDNDLPVFDDACTLLARVDELEANVRRWEGVGAQHDNGGKREVMRLAHRERTRADEAEARLERLRAALNVKNLLAALAALPGPLSAAKVRAYRKALTGEIGRQLLPGDLGEGGTS